MCSGKVLLLKPDGRVGTCVDLGKLNHAVLREILHMMSADWTVTKFDADSSIWQLSLCGESELLTIFLTHFSSHQPHAYSASVPFLHGIFQRHVTSRHVTSHLHLLKGVEGVVCHMDDILVYISHTRNNATKE